MFSPVPALPKAGTICYGSSRPSSGIEQVRVYPCSVFPKAGTGMFGRISTAPAPEHLYGRRTH
eukprot:11930628-Alexandrium_andersonii.AAC.1